jgi:uncharacterized integral membrane protein
VGTPDEPVTPTPPIVDATAATADPQSPDRPIAWTRVSRLWVRILPALVVLIVILVFVFQNNHPVTVKFFGASGTLGLSVALLGAAVLGALLVLALGSVRIYQLRRRVHRQGRNRPDSTTH